ncbi:hypothetical protein CAter10_0836 [Collimonas arenae]|nr:hypothetical protein CAter10_0836 [Collimonas arenae]
MQHETALNLDGPAKHDRPLGNRIIELQAGLISSFRSIRSNNTCIVMSVGLLITTPSAPLALCSHK